MFSIFAIITYLFIEYVIGKLINNATDKQVHKLIILRSTSFIVILVTIVALQLNYIAKRETLTEENCTYYDQYDNVVMYNLFRYSCPELEVETQTEDSFIFHTEENLTTTNPMGLVGMGMTDFAGMQDTTFEVAIRIDTSIEYEDTNIVSYDSNLTINVSYVVDGDEKTGFYSFHRYINNTYQTGSFESNQYDALMIEEDSHDLPVKHYSFLGEDYTHTRMYTTPITINQASDAEYDIMKDVTYPGSDVKTTLVRHVMRHRSDNSDAVEYHLYTSDEDYYDGIEYSMFDDEHGEYLRIEHNTRDEDSRLHWYDLNYEKNDDEVYQLFYHGDVSGTNIPFTSDLSYYKTRDIQTGTTLFTNNDDIYEIRDTTYGQQVVEWRQVHYRLFTSIEKQTTNPYLSTSLSFRNIHDYLYNIQYLNRSHPPFIINGVSPFCLE